jgi:hypothetical protein
MYSRGASKAPSREQSVGLEKRGRGECRARRAHPQPRMPDEKSIRVSTPRLRRFTRHSRTRMVLTVSFGLSPGTGLSCPRRLRGCASQAWHQRRDAGTTRLRRPRSTLFVFQRTRVHRIPLPTSVTIAKRPSCGNGTAGDMDVIWGKREGKYFWGRGLDRWNRVDPVR